MVVRIDMIQHESCFMKRVKLRAYLRLELLSDARVKEKFKARSGLRYRRSP